LENAGPTFAGNVDAFIEADFEGESSLRQWTLRCLP